MVCCRYCPSRRSARRASKGLSARGTSDLFFYFFFLFLVLLKEKRKGKGKGREREKRNTPGHPAGKGFCCVASPASE